MPIKRTLSRVALVHLLAFTSMQGMQQQLPPNEHEAALARGTDPYRFRKLSLAATSAPDLAQMDTLKESNLRFIRTYMQTRNLFALAGRQRGEKRDEQFVQHGFILALEYQDGPLVEELLKNGGIKPDIKIDGKTLLEHSKTKEMTTLLTTALKACKN